jgi:hypothetical protein
LLSYPYSLNILYFAFDLCTERGGEISSFSFFDFVILSLFCLSKGKQLADKNKRGAETGLLPFFFFFWVEGSNVVVSFGYKFLKRLVIVITVFSLVMCRSLIRLVLRNLQGRTNNALEGEVSRRPLSDA